MREIPSISKKLNKLSKRISYLLTNNWFFFSNFDSKKYNLSYEKVIGEFLVYSLITKNQEVYSRVLNTDFNEEDCRNRLIELSRKYRINEKYLKPNERMDISWTERRNISCLKRKTMFMNSELLYEDDLYLCNYLDLYNFTHDAFWGLDFGRIPINTVLDLQTISCIFDKAIKNYYFALLSHHYDLASENIIVLLILSDYIDDARRDRFIDIFDQFYKNVVFPFLSNEYNLKKDYRNYHIILVLGLLGGIYEYCE